MASKISLAQRWVLLKSAFKGQIPLGVEKWIINPDNLETDQNTKQKEMLGTLSSISADKETLKKEWMADYQNKLSQKNIPHSEKAIIIKAALGCAWYLKELNTPELKKWAQLIWNGADVRQDKAVNSILNWSLTDLYPNQDENSFELDFSTLSLGHKQKLMGWAILIGNTSHSQTLWEMLNKPSQLTSEINLCTWACLFDHLSFTTNLLDYNPNGYKAKTNLGDLDLEMKAQIHFMQVEAPSGFLFDGFNSAFWAAQWNSKECLKELAYRGVNLNERTVKGESALYKAIDNSSSISEILIDNGAFAREFEPGKRSALSLFVQKFPPNLPSKNDWNTIFEKALQNTDTQSSLSKLNIGTEYTALAFQVIREKREYALLGTLLDFLDKEKVAWQNLGWSIKPKEGKTTVKNHFNLYEAGFDEGRDLYMAEMAGRALSLNSDLFYRLIMWTPGALPAWLNKTSKSDLVQVLASSTPKIPNEEERQEVYREKNRPIWKENDHIINAAINSREPFIALKNIMGNEDILGYLTTEPNWAEHLLEVYEAMFVNVYQSKWEFKMAEVDSIYNLLRPHLDVLDWDKIRPLYALKNLLYKGGRNLLMLDHLLEQNLIPLNHIIDDEGNTLFHEIIKKEDTILFEKILNAGANFEIPNKEGMTAFSLSLQSKTPFHTQLIEYQKNHIEMSLNEGDDLRLKNKKRI